MGRHGARRHVFQRRQELPVAGRRPRLRPRPDRGRSRAGRRRTHHLAPPAPADQPVGRHAIETSDLLANIRSWQSASFRRRRDAFGAKDGRCAAFPISSTSRSRRPACGPVASLRRPWRSRRPRRQRGRRRSRSAGARDAQVTGPRAASIGTAPDDSGGAATASRRTTHSVMQLARQEVGLARLSAEIQRCEVRCVNCHRRRTARDTGAFRARAEYPQRESNSRYEVENLAC